MQRGLKRVTNRTGIPNAATNKLSIRLWYPATYDGVSTIIYIKAAKPIVLVCYWPKADARLEAGERPVCAQKQSLTRSYTERLVMTQSSRSGRTSSSLLRHTLMAENSRSKGLSWPARALVGALLGCFVGVFYLLPDFTAKGLLASMVAGAVFSSIIGVFGILLSEKPGLMVLLCMIAGGIAGRAWAGVLESDWQVPVIWGAILGIVLALVEAKDSFSSEDEAGR